MDPDEPERPRLLHGRDPESGEWITRPEQEGQGRMHGPIVSEFLHLSGAESIRVVPAPKVLEMIARDMLVIDSDRMYFEAVERDDGTVLLTVHYGQIIGSRWLAVIPKADFRMAIRPCSCPTCPPPEGVTPACASDSEPTDDDLVAAIARAVHR